VLVCAEKDLERLTSMPRVDGLKLGVYNSEQAGTEGFKQVFCIGGLSEETPNVPFQPQVLYRRHLNPKEANYYRSTSLSTQRLRPSTTRSSRLRSGSAPTLF
jgi:hypothetical protein